MIFADFFSGMGGFSEGARQAGGEVRFAANHWDEACGVHHLNFPEAPEPACQDLQQLDMRALPDLSRGILLAAPACQGHSQNAQPARAGRGGSHAPDAAKAAERTRLQRSTAWAIISAAEIARPKAIVVENVPDFLKWELFASWSGCLEALGYRLRSHVLNTRDYGSPQERRRMILTAHQGDPIKLAEEWSGRDRGLSLGDVLDLNPEHPDHRWTEIDAKSQRMRSRMRKAQAGAGSRCVWNNVSESKGRAMADCAPTLTTKSGSQLYLLDGDRGRILNPRELARIQGFPDTYQIPSNRALAGGMIGNAIDVRMARGVCAQAMAAVA